MSISSVFMILSYISSMSGSRGVLMPIDACVAKIIISRTNKLFDHGIPYPMPDDREYLLPGGVKILRHRSYMIKGYSKDDVANLRDAIATED